MRFPSGEESVINSQSSENSENAAVEIDRKIDHDVGKAENDDEPALTLNKVCITETEDGDTVTEEKRIQSAQQSSASASYPLEDIKSRRHMCDTILVHSYLGIPRR